MGKAIPRGSLAVIFPKKSYERGDIVSFYGNSRKNIVTHRIISIEDGLYITKGDANKIQDDLKLTDTLIIGKVLFSVDKIGRPILYAKTIPGLILLVIIPATIIVYEEIKKILFLISKNNHKNI
jgi:signal peptidase